nr:DNA cytosine methyltransferase [uncultured Desulfovibrio sp.]
MAWQPLGWKPVAFAEIEPFPCAVLACHYPEVANLGDITQVHDWRPYHEAVDLVVAGKRAGLAGERSGLALAFAQVLSIVRPEWIVWENVPGVFSTNGGRDFGTFLRTLDDIGYSCAWRVLDAAYFGVPQRRRRVFVVGHLGDWRPAAAVLFEREGVRGNTPARGKKRTDIAGTLDASLGSSRGAGTPPGAITQALTGRMGEGGPDDNKAQGGFYVPEIVAQALSCKWSKGTSGPAGDEYHNLVSTTFSTSGIGAWREGIGPLRAREQDSHENLCLTWQRQVRRLTPRECERLQGFPDDYTLIPYRGKPAADCPDAPRYRALGNSMAVPVMRWIGQRIENQTARCR